MANKPTMTYVPTFEPKDLPWYEREGLMTWYNQGQCENFLRDTDKHFKDANVISFDIMHRQVRGEEIPSDLLKYHQTVNDKTVLEYPTSDQEKFLVVHFGQIGKIFFWKTKIKKHFNEKTGPKNSNCFIS